MKQGKEKLRKKERQQHSQIDQCDRSSADDARCQLKTVGFDLDLPLGLMISVAGWIHAVELPSILAADPPKNPKCS
jgi:hypothetical protein